jgi:hypothetical protein
MSRAKKISSGILVVLALAGVIGWFAWLVPTRRAVDIGAAMMAKQICSCLHIAKRELQDCRADQFAAMDPIQIELLPAEGRVRAFVPLLGKCSAIHREGFGCSLE